MEFAELLEVGFGGRLGHHFNATVVFRKCDDIADAVLAGDQHDESVEAEGDAAVRWSAEFEGLEDMAEEELLLFFVHAEHAKHLGLEVGLVDSQAAAADFHAVENDIVSHSTDFSVFARFEEGHVIRAGTSEWMVNGIPLLFLFTPAEEREIDDPEEIEGGRSFESVQHFGDAQAHAAEGFTSGLPLVGTE